MNKLLWLARGLIGLVLAWNLQCAVSFLAWPGAYAPGFALAGAPGAAAVQGMGILFVMWNVPYAVAATHPVRRLASLQEAAAMQAIGLLGESWLLLGLAGSQPALQHSLLRFIVFDAAGLLLLLAAWGLSRRLTVL